MEKYIAHITDTSISFHFNILLIKLNYSHLQFKYTDIAPSSGSINIVNTIFSQYWLSIVCLILVSQYWLNIHFTIFICMLNNVGIILASQYLSNHEPQILADS